MTWTAPLWIPALCTLALLAMPVLGAREAWLTRQHRRSENR